MIFTFGQIILIYTKFWHFQAVEMETCRNYQEWINYSFHERVRVVGRLWVLCPFQMWALTRSQKNKNFHSVLKHYYSWITFYCKREKQTRKKKKHWSSKELLKAEPGSKQRLWEWPWLQSLWKRQPWWVPDTVLLSDRVFGLSSLPPFITPLSKKKKKEKHPRSSSVPSLMMAN